MAQLEHLTRGAQAAGMLPDRLVHIVDLQWCRSAAVELAYQDAGGHLGSELIFRGRKPTLTIAPTGPLWSFDADAAQLRLVSEADRTHLAHLFDYLLAAHTALALEHFAKVRQRKEPLVDQTRAGVGERLTKEIIYWVNCAKMLKTQGLAGKVPARLTRAWRGGVPTSCRPVCSGPWRSWIRSAASRLYSPS
jgi:hypothetical protein